MTSSLKENQLKQTSNMNNSFKIGSYSFKQALCLAPMEDHSDLAYRILCKELGADIVYTEFASSEALIRDSQKTFDKIKVLDTERPVGIQIFGGDPNSMEQAARITQTFNPDFIDINCGCWVKKVVGKGAGAGLLKDTKQFKSVVEATMKGTTLPVSVKTRLGWDKDNIIIIEIAKMLQDLGIVALTVHCRTRDQGHKGEADWRWLEKLKKEVQIPIIGNGDIKSPQDVKKMLETGCDGVMIGRGALENPWIFQEAKHFLKTGELLPQKTALDRVFFCQKHLKKVVEFKGEEKAVIEFRKFYSHYLKGIPHASIYRNKLVQIKQLSDVINILTEITSTLEDN